MESPHDTNRLRYITSDLIYMVVKSKIFIERTPRNLTVETFVRIVSRILMSTAFFYLDIIIYEVLTDEYDDNSSSRFSSSATPRNLTVETFVRIVSRILISNAFFNLDIIIYEGLLTFRESLLVLSQ